MLCVFIVTRKCHADKKKTGACKYKYKYKCIRACVSGCWFFPLYRHIILLYLGNTEKNIHTALPDTPHVDDVRPH